MASRQVSPNANPRHHPSLSPRYYEPPRSLPTLWQAWGGCCASDLSHLDTRQSPPWAATVARVWSRDPATTSLPRGCPNRYKTIGEDPHGPLFILRWLALKSMHRNHRAALPGEQAQALPQAEGRTAGLFFISMNRFGVIDSWSSIVEPTPQIRS
jgi:hypothetical protein